jgi:hypothetical protein
MKILLADDDRLQTLMIAGRLKVKGHKVIVANSSASRSIQNSSFPAYPSCWESRLKLRTKPPEKTESVSNAA